ncbi:DMT family transporter [Consotaella aegiceratis]|uniref:DMT family transporter n=1 Tax=Consotaella aegiceratis TaxID=3097961 RepID=UPI002F3EB10C
MLSRMRHPYVLLVFTTLFWGGNAIAGKLAVGHVSPMMLTLLRWSLSVALIAPFALGHVRRDWPMILPRLPVLFALGATGFTLFNAIFYVAVTYTTAINVTIEQSAMPLIVFLGNFVLFRARVAPLQIAGFALTLVGVMLTASHGELRTLLALELNRGDAIMMIAVFVYAAYTVGLRFRPPIHWLSLIFMLAASAWIAAIPFAAFEWWSGNARLPDAQGFAVGLYTSVFASLLAQTLYIQGVGSIGANRANLFVNLVPIFGAALSVIVLREELQLYHVAALAFVLCGITLAEHAGRRNAQPDAKTAPHPRGTP